LCAQLTCDLFAIAKFLLAPSWAALQQFLDVLEMNCTKLDVVCNTKKTVCMMFKTRCREKIVADKFPPFHIGCQPLTYLVDEHSALPAPIAWKYLISNFPPSAAELFRLPPHHRSGTHYTRHSRFGVNTSAFQHQLKTFLFHRSFIY